MELGDLSRFVTSRVRFLGLEAGEQYLHPKATYFRNFREHSVINAIASGMAYMHENHVIHGDMKAANVLLDNTLQPKICDFGLAKVLHTEYESTSTGLKGGGTCRWMSPELLGFEGGNTKKTTESDVYAFGMTIAEILSAKVPLPHLHHPWTVAVAVHAGKRPVLEPASRAGQSFDGLWKLAASCWVADPSLCPRADMIMKTLAVSFDGVAEGSRNT
ncbi:hypothetical protein FRB95_007392 [Tulasnella sp. JGI-2019a]|nr:hypothetical protein FRB95_007392 [Tulasnella sp. JGI-2019a]